MSSTPYSIINAFVPQDSTDAETGNPAAVVVLPATRPGPDTTPDFDSLKHLYPTDDGLHAIAKRLDKPMTSFILPLEGHEEYGLRWFNVRGEWDMCGHGTIAAGHRVLSDTSIGAGHGKEETVRFVTKAGLVTASASLEYPSGEGVVIDLPAAKSFESLTDQDDEKVRRMLATCSVAGMRYAAKVNTYIVVELDSNVDLAGLKVDSSSLAPFAPRSIAMFQLASPLYEESQSTVPQALPHVRTRVFTSGPGGYAEDSATGSAHAIIVPHVLSARLDEIQRGYPELAESPAGPFSTIRIKQCSVRGGEMIATWSKPEGRVRLHGRAVKVQESVLDE